MRISDWSSDVCSSDLSRRRVRSPESRLPSRRSQHRRRCGRGGIGRRRHTGCIGAARAQESCEVKFRLSVLHSISLPAFWFSSVFHGNGERSEEHTSELQSLLRISYAVFCLKKKNKT